MKWNWQRADWPHFSWKSELLAKAESLFLMGSGVFVGAVKHLSKEDKDQLMIEAMSTDAVTTSEIEGEILNRSSVQSSVRRQLGLKSDDRNSKPAEQGVAEMMVDLYRSFAQPLSDRTLFSWQRMLMKGRQDLKDIGRYRKHEDPMQVVSGAVGSPHIHFEAPPSSRMSVEMARFNDWFNKTAPKEKNPLPAVTRAGLAHLYFVSIHPFEDGNGRVGRAISEKSLAQTLGRATLTGLATTILVKRKSYYDALEAANKHNEVTEWLIWFAETAIEAQRRTTGLVEFLIAKAKLLDRLRGQLNERQEKALLRVLKEGPSGFKGGLSAGNYITITGASSATATRDLVDMVAKGAFMKVGERRHARYSVDLGIPTVSAVTIDKLGEIKA